MSSFDGLSFVTRLALVLDPNVELPLDQFVFTADTDDMPDGWRVLYRSTDIVLRRLFIFHQVVAGNETLSLETGLATKEDAMTFRVERTIIEGLIVRQVVALTKRQDLLLREHTYSLWQKPSMSKKIFLVIFREVTSNSTA